MSISIQTPPPLVAISGNPVYFKLATDNNIEIPGIRSIAQLIFVSVATENDTLTLSWADKVLVFTFKDTPDESGLQLPTSPSHEGDWTALITSLLSLNYYIDKDFIVTTSATDIFFTSRLGSSANIMAIEFSWTGTEPGAYYGGGTDEVARTFFKIGLQLLILNGSTFEKVGEDALPVDNNKMALFDIHNLFADQLESEFKFPDASDQLIILRSNMCREYRIRYFERFGSGQTPQILTESDSFFILKAGISHLQEAIYNRQESSLWEKITYNDYFLTWQPKSKLIDRYQTEKLYYLVQDTKTSLDLKIEITYNDGTAQSTVTKESIANPQVKGVYEFALTLNTLQLSGYDGSTIQHFRAWVEDGDSNRISEIRTFEMDYEPHENIRYFLFQNSLGGFDTLRITGDVSDSIEHERVDITKILGSAFTEVDHKIEAGIIREIKKYSANTGWKTEADVSWLRDFLLSKQIYQVSDANKLIPILITSTSANQRRDRDDLFSISFEYRRAFNNKFYSKQITYADFNNDFNDDYTNE